MLTNDDMDVIDSEREKLIGKKCNTGYVTRKGSPSWAILFHDMKKYLEWQPIGC